VSGDIGELCAELLQAARGRPRTVVAIAGAPGSGKSTIAEALMVELERRVPGCAAILPMDGFHYDNAVLDALGRRARKGAPETFDVDGLKQAIDRIRRADRPVAVPVFDRALDLARAGASIIAPGRSFVLVEGNYLLLTDPPWSDLRARFDRTLFLSVPEAELERRLVERWVQHDHTPEEATARALGNDMPNARLVIGRSAAADVIWPANEPLGR
jgi:pantothenate kinase